MAIKLQEQGEKDCLAKVLAKLSEADRTVYARPLSEYFTETLYETMGSEIPQSFEHGNATIELPTGFTPAASGGASPGPRPEQSTRIRLDSLEDDFELEVPERIGKFLIKKELGRGAFGVVYLGYDEELQRNVAVKVSLVSDPKLQERLRVEAAKLAQAESPGIVPVYHIGRTEDGKVYIVQKFVEGSTLRDVLRHQPLSPLVAVALLREIALGLGPAHALDILHRDLKPDNILLEANGKAWIADFGLAISEDEQIDHKRELAGTPPYMSPEQIRGRVHFLDPRSDIWALGVMFYEMLTGKLPFKGQDRKAITEQICEMDPRPLHQRAPGLLTESMNQVFLKCCAKKPSDRYATVAELVEGLDQLVQEGLSDQNIHGQATLEMGGFSSVAAGGLETTRRLSTLAHGQGPTTRTTTRMSSASLQEPSSRRNVTWGVAIAALGLSVAGIIGYTLYAQRSTTTTDNGSAQGSVLQHGSDVVAMDSDAARLMASGGGKTNPSAANGKRLGDGSKERPWLVAPGELGTHATIQAAIAEASPGDFILVNAGLYRESLRITKPLTLEGRPPKSGVYPCMIENDQESPLTIDCAEGQVKLRSFMISGKGHRLTNEFNPVEVIGGELLLESCSLETRSQNCVKVRGDARLSVLACKFIDSSEFAVSATDFSQVSIIGSDFLVNGIEVTGGSGTVESCKFFGEAGVYVANNLNPVEVTNCLFEKNHAHALLATDGGNLKVTRATIRGSKTGVGVTDKPMTTGSPIVGRPGMVKLFQTKLEQCEVGLQIDGGTLEASDECFLDGGEIAVGISTGKADLNGVSIGRVTEKALVIYQGGEANLRMCNLSGCDQTAVKITHGKLTMEGGSIEDFKLYGIMMGEQKMAAPLDIQVVLDGVTVKSEVSEVAAVIAFCGRLELQSVILDGARYGLYVDGQALGAPAGAGPAVTVMASSTRFKNQAGFAVVALGDARLTMDPNTHTSLSASGGLKASPPAQVVVDERGQ